MGVTIALFVQTRDYIAPNPTARMLGNLHFLGHEIHSRVWHLEITVGMLRGSPFQEGHLTPNMK